MKPTWPLIAATLALLPLAACDKGPSVSASNATPEEVQAKVAAAAGGADATLVEPGRWEGKMTVQEIDIPNMPPQAKERMKAEMGNARSFVSCVTPDDVKANKAFFTGDEDKNCKYDHFTLTGGKIDAAMTCDQGGGAKMSVVMNGTYSPQAYAMTMASKTEGASPMGPMTMRVAIDAKRAGVCKGTPDEN